ncbi:unnamed protein product [marine sediment metagenome]|uniref:Uncharacterized protein n=1 Tax=marine sediment metagenome TaxID=412755 RepID=X0ZN74_9ZZZZ
MKTFLIVLVMMATADLGEDLYIIQEPKFQQPNQCVQFVQANTSMLVAKAQSEYIGRAVADIFCVPKNRLQLFLRPA